MTRYGRRRENNPSSQFAENSTIACLLGAAWKSPRAGWCVHVGAREPDANTVTKQYCERDDADNIEPVRQYFEMLEVARPRDANFRCAVGARLEPTREKWSTMELDSRR